MPTFRSGRIEIIADDSANGLWNAMTEPMETSELSDVRLRFWFGGRPTGLTTHVTPGLQFSPDPFTWDLTTYPMRAIGSSFDSVAGWKFPTTSFTDVFTLTSPQLYCRFGAAFKNLTNSLRSGILAEVVVDARPVRSRTITAGPVIVFSKGDTSTEHFNPVTDWIKTEDIAQYRLTWEIDSLAGAVVAQAAYRTSDQPRDPTDWSAVSTLGSTRSTAGIEYGTSFLTSGVPFEDPSSSASS